VIFVAARALRLPGCLNEFECLPVRGRARLKRVSTFEGPARDGDGAIVGGRRPAQVDDWLRAAGRRLDARALAEIGEAIAVAGAGDDSETPTGFCPPRELRRAAWRLSLNDR
jgi:hypothetical protein